MSFVRARMIIPPRSLVAGIPAKVIRELAAEDVAQKMLGTAQYQENARRSFGEMIPCEPLAAPEPDRKRVTWENDAIPLYGLKKN